MRQTCRVFANKYPGSSSTYNILLLGFHINGHPHKTQCQQELEKKCIFQLYRLQWGASQLRQQRYVIATEQLCCNTVNRQHFLVVMTLVPAIRALQTFCSLCWMTWWKISDMEAESSTKWCWKAQNPAHCVWGRAS